MLRLAATLALVTTASGLAFAQVPGPDAPAAPNGAQLFRNQCATCHTLAASEPARQGPNLEHVYGRKIGSVEPYKYTSGYREAGDAGETWTEERLDKYLTNPAAVFPGSTMAYRQANANTRRAIIAYLKDGS